MFVVASEPYGLVEETAHYVRLDGETPSDPDNPTASRGQVVVLDGAAAGTLSGIGRLSYDGTSLPVTSDDVQTAQITTRDIDRGAFPHFLLKEMHEAPASCRKTLRGQIVEQDGRLVASLGPDTLPLTLVERLRSGAINRVIVIGQGTAAIAGQSLAVTLAGLTEGVPLRVEATPATELSGFGMRADMSDTLVIAISQSGTHHRHQPHRRRRALARGASGDRHRQPAQQRPHRADRRRALHVRRARRRDERRVDEGVLRAGRRRLPARVRARRGARRAGCRATVARSCSGLRELPDAMQQRHRAAAPRSPRPRSGSRRAAATGRSSATGSTASRRRRSGSSSPSSATSRSPATRPRTRSTSICRPSR